MRKKMTQLQINIQDTIKKGLKYHREGDLNFAIGQLSLAVQLIAQQQRDQLAQEREKLTQQVQGLFKTKSET